MAEAFLIMLREGFEATLVVAIVFAYLRKLGRRDLAPSAWGGMGLGVVLATAVGLVVHWTVGELEGRARLVSFAVISGAAAVVLTWMIFWMRRQSGAISGELRHKVDAAIDSGRAGTGVALVAFTAVLREGIEAALFLIATTVDDDSGSVALGAGLGLVSAAALGLVVYGFGRTMALRTFFKVTGVVLILFAAGLCAKAIFFLQAAHEVGTANDAFYDLTSIHWLTVDSEWGKFLSGLFGWDPRPSLEQFVVWMVYVVPVLGWFLFGDRLHRRTAVARTAS
jgi:high-affinity iron transporter